MQRLLLEHNQHKTSHTPLLHKMEPNLHKSTPPHPDKIWKQLFTNSFKNCRETIIQSFQYKLLHRTIPCNQWLHNIKIKDTNTCDLCPTLIDTIQHHLIMCPNIHQFWMSFFLWWNRTTNNSIPLILENPDTTEIILFGSPGDTQLSSVLNYCLLQAKYHIYCKKINSCNNFDLYSFLIFLKKKLDLEKCINGKNNRTKCFEKFKIIYDNI